MTAIQSAIQVVPGQYLCAPSVYAPAVRTAQTVNTTTMAAWSSGNITTNSFTAPPSGSVVVTVDIATLNNSVSGDLIGFGLAAHGTVTPLVANIFTIQAINTNWMKVTLVFYVTGLTPGTSYQFDLLGCATSTSTATIEASGSTNTTLQPAGGPVTMTVQAVLMTSAPYAGVASTTPWAAANTTAGPLNGYRGYNPPSAQIPPAWPGVAAGPVPSGVPAAGTIISCRPTLATVLAGTYDTAISAWAATIPPGAYVTFWHEGETQGFLPADLIAGHQRVYALVKAAAPGALYGQIFNGPSAYPASPFFPMSQWAATGLDWYGCDAYPQNSSDPASVQLGLFEGQLTAAGVAARASLTMPECNSASTAGIAPETWFRSAWQHATTSGRPYAHLLGWFSTSAGDPNEVWPPDSAVLAELAAYAAASRAANR